MHRLHQGRPPCTDTNAHPTRCLSAGASANQFPFLPLWAAMNIPVASGSARRQPQMSRQAKKRQLTTIRACCIRARARRACHDRSLMIIFACCCRDASTTGRAPAPLSVVSGTPDAALRRRRPTVSTIQALGTPTGTDLLMVHLVLIPLSLATPSFHVSWRGRWRGVPGNRSWAVDWCTRVELTCPHRRARPVGTKGFSSS